MNIDIRFYTKLFLHRFPVMALLFTICTGLAVFTALRLPETYNTSARLLVEEPQIPESMVASTIRTDAGEQLDIIQQRLLTRANLIDIANRFDVFENPSELEPDTIVELMQNATSIRRSDRRGSATLMSISFEGRSGAVVANVVNEYVTLVLEANINFRLGRAENTLDFFSQEAERLGSALERQSTRIAAFTNENSDALPENQTFRMSRQSLLQERLSRLERESDTIIAQRREIERIFEATGQVGAENSVLEGQTPEQQQLILAQTDLQQALLVYSAENPRVIRQQNLVDRLEAIVANQTAANFGGPEVGEDAITPAEAMFRATVLDIDNRIEAATADISDTQRELDDLERAIAASAINGIALSALEREFNVIQTQYNAAVTNLNQAQMSERIETTAQGQRVSVIENANIPRWPSGPNRKLVAATGAAIGIALAGGLFVLLEVLNRTIRRPVELINKFNVTPIATIPYLETSGRRTLRRFSLIVASMIAITGVPLALLYIDANYIPLDLLVQRILTRLNFT